ncbi:microtubule-associated protein futsch isoform X2 [Scaptodrosophila lebanonensis]|nr:microtubule-associated protein futsch isoform X2 [Scaptodrosophila lebanonensis]XP_030381055.1 microtubule-associated protein futsch isoform X2 [Scaptodrosophila lebanonensis]XP_030381057.1 microtubule-associated protein futsch isoform X2 [Scaptodrosophila lebanonensis]
MSDNANTVTGYGKDPLTTSHGDALMDQSFQSLKSKEVRDSMSPTHDIKFHSLSLNQPNTTGWDVQTSSEVSPDGRAYRTETVAKTDGVEKLNGGGIAEFKGRNEQRSSASHQGDDKNFVKKASESSDTHLQEKVVFGDENSGRTEMKMSSTTSSSTSQVVSSSSHVEYDDGAEPQRYLLDSQTSQQQRLEQQRQERRLHEERDRIQEQQRRVKQQQLIEERERVQEQHQRQQQQRYSEERHESREQSNTTKNVQTQQHYEENKRYVDMDKASPEYQRHVQHLMAQPGEIISNTVEYPKPNVKMITTVKKLPDGTIVKNKRYETEELRPGNESVRQTNTNTNYSQHRAHDERDQREDRYVKQSPTPRGSEPRDVVDNVETVRRQSAADELTTQSQSYSSVKKSSRRFSTETTSETIEEYDDHPNGSHKSPSPGRDFSTHGFPSVKPHKPTQEYPTDRPSTPQTPRQPTSDFSTQGFPSVKPHKPTQEYPTQRAGTPSSPRQPPTQDFSTHGFPSVRPNKLTQEYPTDRPSSVNEVRYGPNGEEIIVVKSEQSRQVKQQTSSQRTIETEYVSDDYPALQDSAPQKKIAAPQQATPSWEQPTTPRRGHVEDDYSTHGFPSARSPRKEHSEPDGEVITSKTTVSRNHSATHKTNTERIIETEVEQPNRRPEQLSSHGYPAARSPTRSPTRTDYIPISPRRTPSREDYTTQGFPSARSPTKTTPDYATKRAPLYKSPPRKPSGQSTPVSTTTKRTTNEATTTTRRQLQKEREVDATHRAFAASLRSSSPAESNHSGSSSHRRDSHTHPHGNQQRHTPRSSISSTKTYRRDTREGSHDSHAPSETSRISSTTVTRHVGPPTTKSVGKTVVTKQTVVKTRNVQGSNETIDLMPQRSPKSPPASGAKSPISKSAPISTTKTTNTTTIITKPAGQPTAPANISSPSTPAAPSNIAPATIAPVPASSPASPPSSASGPGPAPASVSSELPQVPDNLSQYTYTTTKPADIFSLPPTPPTINNEPTLTTKYNNNNNNQSNNKPNSKSTNNTENEITKIQLSTNDASHALIEEPLCVKRHYYKLGPSDKAAAKNAPATPEAPASPAVEPALTATALINSETVATPKSRPHVTPNESPSKINDIGKRTPQSNRKPNHTINTTTTITSSTNATHDDVRIVGDDVNRQSPIEEREPSRRSSKSPSVDRRTVLRETTYEKLRDNSIKRVPQTDDVLHIDEQIVIDESEVRKSPISPKPRTRSQTSQSPERQLPVQLKPREKSPEKQLPGELSPRDVTTEKPLPTSTKPRQELDTPIVRPTKPKEAPQPTKSPRHSPEKQLPSQIKPREKARHSPEKQLPEETIPYSPKRQQPNVVSPREETRPNPDEPLSDKTKPKEIPEKPQINNESLQSPQRPLSNITKPRESPKEQQPILSKPRDAPRQSPEKQIPGPTQNREEVIFQSINTQNVRNTTNNFNEEFITNERITQKPISPRNQNEKQPEPDIPESTDGGFISKSPEPDQDDDKPTYRKKGLSRRETFEDRCRKILGMEEDGDTQGTYVRSDDEQPQETIPKVVKETFDVRIEDCPDDDEDDKPRGVIETFVVRQQFPSQPTESPLPDGRSPQLSELTVDVIESEEVVNSEKTKKTTEVKKVPKQRSGLNVPVKTPKNVEDTVYVNKENTIVVTVRPEKSPSPQRNAPATKHPSPHRESPTRSSKSPSRKESLSSTENHFVTEKIIDCNEKTIVEKISKTPRNVSPTSRNTAPVKKLSDESEPEELPLTKSETKKPQIFKPETERRSSRTTTTVKTTRSAQPQPHSPRESETKTPIGKSPLKDSPARTEPAKVDRLVEETSISTIKTSTSRNKQGRKPSDVNASPSIKDRLRSSPRKPKPQKDDDVDGESSSSDVSPVRVSERRRSSNISVHTEIIIDHTEPKSPKLGDRKPSQPKGGNSPVRKFPVTERKESAPVPRVTRRDKDKVTRSTSENVIKVVNGKPQTPKQPEMSTLNPNTAQRPSDRGRPSKCFTTKTINLTTSEKLINSEEMENVIIDIQHAKSSREPSPDKIVPTPVPTEFDTGNPRYPDVVQEPDDEPRKKPVVTNIPIFEEETNDYVGCRISEVRSSKDQPDENGVDEILDNPTIEAPKSLDWNPTNGDDECLLSVHEKVTKFTNTAEKTKQPKSSAPFSREFDRHAKVADNDECLLSINQKVDKFLKTAESITMQPITPTREVERPSYEDIDEELLQDDCTLSVSQKVHKFIDTAEKLAPTAPQKSPRLVANIERHISRQNEPELDQESEPEGVIETDAEDQIEKANRNVVLKQFTKRTDRTEVIKEPNADNVDTEPEQDDVVPMTKNHTIAIELQRQKDILSRPSVLSPKSVPRNSTPISAPKSKQNGNKPKSPQSVERKLLQPNERTSPVTPKVERPSASLIAEERRAYKSQQTKSVSTTKSRFETPRQREEIPRTATPTPKRRPSAEQPSPKTGLNRMPATTAEISTTDSETEFVKSSYRATRPESDVDEESSYPQSPSPTHMIRSKPAPSTHTATKTTVVKTTTEHSTKQTPTTNPLSQPDNEPSVEPLLDQTKTPSSVGKPPIHTSVGRTRVAADTVASRRNLFEKQSPTSTPTKSEETGRRPSYMDHTKSSLEHIRRDSLEINKTNYSRKSSVEDETTYEPRNPNTAVKFDVPKRTTRKEPSCSINDDTNIEEIFDLQVLEELLETVSSYELRRRIRAQIRLIKKNMINSGSTIVTSTTTKTTTVSSKNETEPPKATTANVSRSPQSSRRVPDQTQPRTPRDRSHSPDAKTISSSMKEVRTSSSRRQTTRTEQVDNASLQGKPPVKPRDRSASPAQDPRTGHRSPTGKRGSTSSSPSTQSPERRRDSAAKTPDRNRSPQTKRVESTTTTTTTTKTSGNRNKPVKGAEKTSAPIWADRSKVLRGHTPVSTPPPKKSSTASSNTKITRTTTSSTGSTSSSQKIKRREEDSITSSYGVGPTDENGLPLFGIRALKKKAHPAHEPCATSEEVTGYVIEEQFYSDNKSAPRRERKELIYSTNADELASLQQQVERKSSQDVDDGSVVVREFKKLDKQATQALGYDADDLNIDRKYVRRGSVKEMSEKFIRKESSQSVTESKTSSSTSTSSSASAYPKAGLILRTNSRLSSQEPDAADETEDSESNEVCSVIESAAYTSQQQLQHSQLDDSSADESLQLRQHSSSTRSKQSTRSFLNTTGEDRVVTGVDDVLQRMRNADNVVEPGDSAEDQEARALLNKFLGASVIMQGVESMLPQGGRTTTTSTRTYTQRGGNNNNNANQGDQAVKTTRVTKTYSKTGNSSNNNNSNSSSSLVTRTTCDIEEIWDEDILKQLLEKASTYEERRKIRARLRELMAEREEQKKAVEQTNAEEEESSASEYEEIIEEVTDYSDEEEEEEKEKPTKAAEKSDQKATSIATAEKVEQAVKAEKREEVESASSKVTATTASAKKSTTKTSSASTSSSISVKETSQTDGGVKATQAQQQQQSSTTSERTETKSKDGGAVVTTTTTKVTTRTVGGSAASKNISPLAKFKQLDKEAAQQQAQKSSPTTSTPTTPGGSVQPLFKFTDPALNARAATVKDQLLQWCQQKTQEYENVQITNFSSSWSDGLAFCALIHHFLPKAFDYSTLTKQNRRHNFELAFGVADEKAGIAPLLDVEDMVEMSRPDWKCVFVYVQSIWRRFRNCQ